MPVVKAKAEPRSDMPISFKSEPELIQDIDAIAREEQRSRSEIMRLALTNYVEQHKNTRTKRSRA